MDDITRGFIRKDLARAQMHLLMEEFWLKVEGVSDKVWKHAHDRVNYHSKKVDAILDLVENDRAADESAA